MPNTNLDLDTHIKKDEKLGPDAKSIKGLCLWQAARISIQQPPTRLIHCLKQCLLHHLEHVPTASHNNHHYKNSSWLHNASIIVQIWRIFLFLLWWCRSWNFKQLDYQRSKILLETEPLNFVICLTLNHTVALVLQSIKKMVNLWDKQGEGDWYV